MLFHTFWFKCIRNLHRKFIVEKFQHFIFGSLQYSRYNIQGLHNWFNSHLRVRATFMSGLMVMLQTNTDVAPVVGTFI